MSSRPSDRSSLQRGGRYVIIIYGATDIKNLWNIWNWKIWFAFSSKFSFCVLSCLKIISFLIIFRSSCFSLTSRYLLVFRSVFVNTSKPESTATAVNTRSYSVVTLRRSTAASRLHLNDHSFFYYAPILWNSPKDFRQPSDPSTTDI